MQDFVPAMMIVAFIGAGLWQHGKPNWNRWRWPAAGVLVFSAILHIHLSFTQPFFTPPPDPSAMKAFIKWGPLARRLLDWPELAKDEAVIRNDLGVHFLQQRRHADALEQFAVADELMPGSPVVEKNLRLTRAPAPPAPLDVTGNSFRLRTVDHEDDHRGRIVPPTLDGYNGARRIESPCRRQNGSELRVYPLRRGECSAENSSR